MQLQRRHSLKWELLVGGDRCRRRRPLFVATSFYAGMSRFVYPMILEGACVHEKKGDVSIHIHATMERRPRGQYTGYGATTHMIVAELAGVRED